MHLLTKSELNGFHHLFWRARQTNKQEIEDERQVLWMLVANQYLQSPSIVNLEWLWQALQLMAAGREHTDWEQRQVEIAALRSGKRFAKMEAHWAGDWTVLMYFCFHLDAPKIKQMYDQYFDEHSLSNSHLGG